MTDLEQLKKEFKEACLKSNPLNLQFQLKHPDAKLPTRGTEGSAGLDLYAVDWDMMEGIAALEYSTGLAVAIPEGYVGLLFPRSSITNVDIRLANCVGVIDSDYRGEIKMRFDRIGEGPVEHYFAGDKIGQLVIVPCPRFDPVQVDSLPETQRGTGGFGSTGRA